MITVQHLTRRFGPLTAVDDVSFSLERGEVTGFLGPNGAGKTTTMRMLTGFLPASSGTIEIGGLDVLRDSLAVRRKLGYLPEAVPFYREHRVLELLVFQARLYGIPRREGRRRARQVLERVGMAERERALFGRLSKGQRQRVGLALALVHDPEVLILDEPTSGLDPLQRIEVRSLISELSDQRTVLVSSHILPEIEAVCPRVIILSKGRIAADGTQAELLERSAQSYVRLEAVVGSDVAAARRLLAAIEGVSEVEDTGRLGIHHGFRIHAAGDLREEVGALAASRGWALRELSYSHPTLESIFARIALELDEGPRAEPAGAPAAAAPPPEPRRAGGPELPLISSAPPPSAPAEQVRPLNPFERAPAKDSEAESPRPEGGGA